MGFSTPTDLIIVLGKSYYFSGAFSSGSGNCGGSGEVGFMNFNSPVF